MQASDWKNLGKALSQNAEILVAFHEAIDDEVFPDDPTASWNHLVDYGFLTGNAHSGYVASQELLQVADMLARTRHRRTMTPDVEEWMLSVRSLVEQRIACRNDGDAEGEQMNLRRIRREVKNLVDAAGAEIERMEYVVDSGFGHQRSMEARIQDNEYAIGHLRRYADKLGAIDIDEMGRIAVGDSTLLNLFFSRLFGTVSRYRERLQALLERLEGALWRQRQVTDLARKVKAVRNYIHTGRVPLFKTDLTGNEGEPVFNIAAPLELSGSADVSIEANESVFAKITESLGGKSHRLAIDLETHEDEEPGEFSFDGEEGSDRQVQTHPVEVDIDAFFRRCVHSDSPVSALDFWQSECDSEFALRGWLLLILHRAERMAAASSKVEALVMPDFADEAAFSGDRLVRDVKVGIRIPVKAGAA